MRKNSKFKLIFVVSILIILFLTPLIIQASGESSNKTVNKYVALGDEVSIESKNYYDISYVSLIKDFLNSLNNDLKYNNLSKEEITASDLINIIDENKEQIKNSDLVTISIGGNDVCNIILKELYNNLNINKEILENCDEDKFEAIISEHLNSDEMILAIQDEVNKFESDFPEIIRRIEKLSPQAQIYVNTVYNPINKKGNLYNFFDSQINLINNIIIKNNSDYNYKIIDCYNILSNNERLNLQVEEDRFELYPNKVGHAMMATQVISDYEDYVNLEVDKVTSNSDNIKGKTLPNSNIIVVSENGTIGTTQAKSNGDFELKISPMISGTNVEVLVYDKKIFSILYKFQKLVVKKELFTS